MHLHTGAIERNGLNFNGNELLALEMLKDPVESAVFAPAVHAGVNGVPIPEASRQSAPFTAVFQNIQNGVDYIEIIQRNIAPLRREAAGNPVVLFLCKLHSRKIGRFPSQCNSVNTP